MDWSATVPVAVSGSTGAGEDVGAPNRGSKAMKTYFVLLGLLLLLTLCPQRTAAQNPDYVGFIEVADCTEVAGWVADKNRLNTSINVTIFDGQTLLATVLANLPRPDVGTGLGDNGLHGYFLLIPNALKNGQPHSISVRFETTSIEATSSPKSITCNPVPPTSASTIPKPKITTFEITNSGDTTRDPNLTLHVEIDHPDRVHFFRLGEITCPESVSDRPEDRMKGFS